MTKLRPIPTADQPWFGTDGKPRVYDYLFDLDRAARTGTPGPAGPQGPVGPQGPQGPQGPKGDTGAQGPTGATGATGAAGATGATGATGPGVASGGTTGQVLKKNSATNYDTAWATLTKADVGLGNVDNVSVAGTWSSWTPTVSSGTGTVTGATITTVAKYKANGKTVHWKVQCTLTNVGSGSPGDAVKFTAPPGLTPLDSYNPAAAFYVNGAVNAGGFISSTGNVFAFKADGTTLWANGNVFVIGGTYEAA